MLSFFDAFLAFFNCLIFPVLPFTCFRVLFLLGALISLFVLHITRYSSERLVLKSTFRVTILNQLEIVGVIVEEIVPLSSIFEVLSKAFVAVQGCFVVSKEEIQGLNGRQARVLFSLLITPKYCLFSLNFNVFQVFDRVLAEIIFRLRPS